MWVDTNHSVYADDTLITAQADGKESLLEILQKEAGKVFKFCASNHLVCNPSKTALMIIRPKGVNDSEKVIMHLDGKEILESKDERVL